MTALDPLEDGRQEFQKWFDEQVEIFRITPKTAWLAAWTARAARERELRETLRQAQEYLPWDPDIADLPPRLVKLNERIKAALSETQPEPQEKP